MGSVLCVDVGSTFTKAVLADRDCGEVLATAEHPTTTPEVLDGIAAVRAATEPAAGRADELLVCSSAGGGLRLAVVGYERQASAEAGHRVALSAGGRVVQVSAGRLDPVGVETLRAARPDLILLTGGTDGGNADVVLHNARRLALARLAIPVVFAGNAQAAGAAAAEFTSRGRALTVTANVLPEIGVLDPLPARQAIREAFLRHVIGGKGLSRGSARLDGRTFAQLVRAPTPDAVLTGVGLLGPEHDVLLVDVGGATTDVYSVLAPPGEAPDGEPAPARPVVAPLWHSRTVEGDLGVRWGARGVVDAAVAEGLLAAAHAFRLGEYADRVRADPGYLPQRPGNPQSQADRNSQADRDGQADRELAALAVLIAVRRHGRATRPGMASRPLRDVGLVVGSGGVLRHTGPQARARILGPLLADHGGGWAVPDRARLAVDAGYTLFAAGLLAASAPPAAARLARAGLVWLDDTAGTDGGKMVG